MTTTTTHLLNTIANLPADAMGMVRTSAILDALRGQGLRSASINTLRAALEEAEDEGAVVLGKVDMPATLTGEELAACWQTEWRGLIGLVRVAA